MSLHTVPSGSLQAKQPCHCHAQLSLGQSCHGQKKPFVYVRRVASAMSDSLQPFDCGLPGFSVGEEGSSSQEYWSILTNAGCHTFLELYIPAALATNTPEYLVLPEPLQPKQLHHLHTWPSQGKPKSSRAAPGANPSGRPTYRGGNKTTVETQGQCG